MYTYIHTRGATKAKGVLKGLALKGAALAAHIGPGGLQGPRGASRIRSTRVWPTSAQGSFKVPAHRGPGGPTGAQGDPQGPRDLVEDAHGSHCRPLFPCFWRQTGFSSLLSICLVVFVVFVYL